ncbi:glutathione S-transferase family protein [Frigidibacter sp. SD6-1]|uniref:glutathione S-transferase family protein n=1 Tax=Frigidibacter sp. SD6-1 TaxID=3032581 RepID=UPI0024DF81CF|nr:glutathione S-transferase family protein [Frigidibacter sp. SD6-1]
MTYVLHQMPGWGSALVELQLAWYGLPCALIETGDLFDSAEARERLGKLNPRAQIPTLILPSGEVMTESAAITLHLADVTGRDDLVPGPGATERAAFLRWLVFIVANIYPCHTFADDPSRFVADPEAAKAYRVRIDDHHRTLWREVAAVVADRGGPWFLGHRFSALDLYLAVLTNWRPGKDWFATEAPGLLAIGRAAAGRPEVAGAMKRNFG